MKDWQWVLVLCAATGLGVWLLFPRIVVETVPRIETVWDTVPVTEWDTVWREKTIEKVVREAGEVVNLVESVTVSTVDTVRDTVFVTQPAICPQVLEVAKKVGNETVIEGFTLQRDTSGGPFLRREFRSVYYTRGPLKAMAISESLPPVVTFYDPIHNCGLGCQVSRVLLGGVSGYAACKVEGAIK